MKRIKIMFSVLLCAMLLSSCGYFENRTNNSDSEVERALVKLLTCDNYSSERITEITRDGQAKGSEIKMESVIFHNPYKARIIALSPETNDKGISYEIEKNGYIEEKTIYQYANGDKEELDPRIVDIQSVTEEFIIRQLKNYLVSEEFIEDVEGVKKYKVTTNAYPFIGLFGFSIEKNNLATRIFVDEYKACNGYVYINSKTNDIIKIEFDLSEKSKLTSKINQRIIEEEAPFEEIYEFDILKITISISNINDDSPEVEEIRKEIDNEMQ